MRNWLLGFAVGLSNLVVASAPAGATVLLFQPASGDFYDWSPLPVGYGNRVTEEFQSGYRYGMEHGPTPNVTVVHSTGGFRSPLSKLFTWTTNYGDLHEVCIAYDGTAFEIKLVADPGFRVQVHSFDMAGWPKLDYTVSKVEVVDQAGHVLFAQNDVHIEGDASGPPHSHFDLTGVVGQSLTIRFDSTNTDSDGVGIDNIAFSQSVPPACPSDLNNDGVTNTGDLTQLLVRFGQSVAPGSTGDINEDGAVNTADLTQLLVAFGRACG